MTHEEWLAARMDEYNRDVEAHRLEALDTRWILTLDLSHGEKLCLLALWSIAEWLPTYGRDYRVQSAAFKVSKILGVGRGTVDGWMRRLRKAGWIRRDTVTVYGTILQRCEAMPPPEIRHSGHVYLVSFSDGRVKVGMSWDPRSRLQSHAMEARRAGLTMVESWISDEVDDAHRVETLAIARLAEVGGNRVGATREYFTGITFADAVSLTREVAQ
jgi:hypothetical protein